MDRQETEVPRLIHHVTFGSFPNATIEACLASWRAAESFGFEIVRWDWQAAIEFIQDHCGFALDAFTNARNLAEASDIARYLIVHRQGGYYVDWDVMLNDAARFEDLHLSFPHGCLLVDPRNGAITPSFLAASPGEEYLLTLARCITALFAAGERDRLATPDYSGPFRMRQVLSEHPGTRQALLRIKDVFEFDYDEIGSAKAFGRDGIMTHLWSHSWFPPAS
jgi:hypothetical protein